MCPSKIFPLGRPKLQTKLKMTPITLKNLPKGRSHCAESENSIPRSPRALESDKNAIFAGGKPPDPQNATPFFLLPLLPGEALCYPVYHLDAIYTLKCTQIIITQHLKHAFTLFEHFWKNSKNSIFHILRLADPMYPSLWHPLSPYQYPNKTPFWNSKIQKCIFKNLWSAEIRGIDSEFDALSIYDGPDFFKILYCSLPGFCPDFSRFVPDRKRE